MKTTEYISNPSMPFCIALCLAILSLIGIVDYITGEEISFSVFYLLPVSLATWRAGKWIGILFFCCNSMVFRRYYDRSCIFTFYHSILECSCTIVLFSYSFISFIKVEKLSYGGETVSQDRFINWTFESKSF